LNNCEYEKIHHRRLAQRAGISAEETQRVIDLDLDGWSPRERAQLAATDQLHRDRNLDERTWHELRQHLDEPAAIEFLLLAGHYTMLATFINTLGIALDHDVRELQQA
jgi:alkylhydroperoxidase family enzyme